MDVDFHLQSDLPRGSKFIVFIPQVAKSALAFECDVVQRYGAMPINQWLPYWYGVNQSLHLTALINFPPGKQSITVGSSSLVLKDTAIYQDDPSLRYNIWDQASGQEIAGGVFDRVVARGLAASSLSYDPPRLGVITSMKLGFIAEKQMLPNDRVYVFLPGFTGVSDNTNMIMPGIGAGKFRAHWNSRINAIMFTILSPVIAINVTVPSSLGLHMSTRGSNNYTGIPTIALRTHNWGSVVSTGYQYIAPTPFLQFTPVAYLVHSKLYFSSPAVAGQETAIKIDLGYSLGISQGDVFSITLPKFWSSSLTGLTVISRSGGSYNATWVACSEVLMIQATNVYSNYSFLNVTIGGMRLPWDGVNIDLANHFNVSAAAKTGSMLPTTIHSTQLVGKFLYSSLVFSGTDTAVFTGRSGDAGERSTTLNIISIQSGTVVNGMIIPFVGKSGTVTLTQCNIASGSGTCAMSFAQKIPSSTILRGATVGMLGVNNALNTTFKLSCALLQGETVRISLPGVTISAAGLSLSEYSPYSATLRTVTYSVAWSSVSNVLTFTALGYIAPATGVTLLVTATTLTLPATGFPATQSTSITISSDAIQGSVVAENFHTPAYVGFRDALMFYEVRDLSQPIGLRFKFALTGALVKDDKVTFTSPFIHSTPAVFTVGASIATTILTIKSVTSGTVVSGMVITGTNVVGSSVVITCSKSFTSASGCASSSCTCTLSSTQTLQANDVITGTGTALELVGDWAEEGFVSSFSGSYLASSASIVFTATTSVEPLREVNIHVGAANKIYLSQQSGAISSTTTAVSFISGSTAVTVASYYDLSNIRVGAIVAGAGVASGCTVSAINSAARVVTLSLVTTSASSLGAELTFTVYHSASASVVSLGGAISARNIAYEPTNLAGYTLGASAGVNISACAHGRSCAIEFDLELMTAIGQGEHLAVSHPNLRRNIDVNELTTYIPSLTLYGNSTKYFKGTWRAGDNTDDLALSSQKITVQSGGRLTTASDNEMHAVNYTLPFKSIGQNTTIATKIPRVVTYYVDGSLSNAVCGDNVILRVQFDEPVVAAFPETLKIMMNTKESARYLEGNGSSTLFFVYNILAPADVTDLKVQGPGAMEFTAPARVVRLGYPGIAANVTLSPPYGKLLRDKGQFKAISVACTGSAVVTKIEQYFYNDTQDAYRTGDELDIKVTFDRDIEAVGTPTLLLSSSSASASDVYVAKYVNVTYSMWLDVHNEGPGQFALSYQSEKTPCLDWNDTKALVRELKALSSLRASLPLKYRVYALANGIRYRFTFSNIAPQLLTVLKLQCGFETTARVFIDSTAGNGSVAIFRYSVGINETANLLTYPNTSAIVQTADNYLFVAGLPRTKRVNGLLPTADSAAGLVYNSPIVVDSAPPTILSVTGNFSELSLGEAAKSGDSVLIYVNYSAPVVVSPGTPLLLLKLTRFIDGAIAGQTLFTRYVPFISLGPTWARAGGAPSSRILIFEYKVRSGDSVYNTGTDYLNYYSSDSLVLNGSSILLASRNPTVKASIKLPDPASAASLRSSGIQVLATQAPALQAIYTDHPTGIYGEGEEIMVFLQFSSAVHVQYNASTRFSVFVAAASAYSTTIRIKSVTSGIVASGQLITGNGILGAVTLSCPLVFSSSSGCETVLCTCTMSSNTLVISEGTIVTGAPKTVSTVTKTSKPTIPLATPLHAHMVYASGSATNTLAFKYTVSAGDSSYLSWTWPSLGSWNMTLVGGYFVAPRDEVQSNYWNFINEVPADLTQLLNVEINTAAPVVLRVNSSSPDGTYYPGQTVDMTVVFNKKVVIAGDSGHGLPFVIVDVPHFENNDHIATYAGGNTTTSLKFKFIVPTVPDALRSTATPRIAFDYAGAASLLLNGSVIKDFTTNPVMHASNYLPARGDSYLSRHRNIFIQLTVPTVERVFALQNFTTVTAGDVLHIAVKFTQKVVVFHPPVLRLATGDIHRNALFSSGNGSDCLVFAYTILRGDSAEVLDYVDTRLPPYNNVKYSTPVSLALNTDTHLTSTGRQIGHDGVARSFDIVLSGVTTYGGVFQAIGSDGRLVLANTALPLPGAVGSLSQSRVIVDTSPPYVKKVFTTIANGAYAQGVTIPIILRWSTPVAVAGCPVVIFRIQGGDRPAVYESGSGTSETMFSFTVVGTDVGSEIDYVDRFALHLRGCNDTQDENSWVYIRRNAAVPTIDSNLTLPWVRYVESVIAPTSLSGSGNLITLSGPYAVPRILWTSQSASRTYSVGDIVDINVGFSSQVAMPNSTYVELMDMGGQKRSVFYQNSINGTVATFPLVVQPDENIVGLSYSGSDALRTVKNCDIFDTDHSFCAAQNLPTPYSAIASSKDGLSFKNISITSASTLRVAAVEMLFTQVSLGEEGPAGTILGVPLAQANGNSSHLCDSSGESWLYSEYLDVQNNMRIISTTGCPNHRVVCQKASCIGDSSGALLRALRWEIPLVPMMARKPRNVSCSTSEVAVALNGVSVYSQSDEEACADAVVARARELDSCGGRSDSSGIYHYRVPPACLLQQLSTSTAEMNHSPQIGWALDGFPVYGPLSVKGLQIAPCASYVPRRNSTGGLVPKPAYCLDECNGIYGEISGVDSYLYRYYIAGPVADAKCHGQQMNSCDRTDDPCCIDSLAIPPQEYRPYSIGCFKGCLSNDYACQQTAVLARAVTSSYFPTVARSPKIRNDGSAATAQSAFEITTTDPQLYLPSKSWDVVSTRPSSVITLAERVLHAGDVAKLAVTMSEAVYVEGHPTLTLIFARLPSFNVTIDAVARFSSMIDDKTLLFELSISPASPPGQLLCSLSSAIVLSGGRIMKAANFLPLLPAEVSLGSACCQGVACLPTVVAEVYPAVPRVTKVFSSDSEGVKLYSGTTYSALEELSILVQFTAPVVVVGSVVLSLSLPDTPEAVYVRKHDARTLVFKYTVRQVDAAATLEYASPGALKCTSSGKFDGIFAQGKFAAVAANLTLPSPGGLGSLSRLGRISLDNSRPKVVSISAVPASATSGDDVIIVVRYSQDMIPAKFGAVFPSSQWPAGSLSDTSTLIKLLVSISPASALSSSSVQRWAELVSVEGSNVSFRLRITPADPSGTVTLGSFTPLALSADVTLVAAKNGATGPVAMVASMVAQPLCIVDNVRPSVVSVSSPNVTARFPWGTGDVLLVSIRMSHRVVVQTGVKVALLLAMRGRIVEAEYVPEVANPPLPYVEVLHFRYNVRRGDLASPLEYASTQALLGDLRRYSSARAVLESNLTLPRPFSLGSLGFCCNVQVDTNRPFISALLPLKKAGLYGEGEQLIIIARFNKPVVVTGMPYLLLNVGTIFPSGVSGEAKMRIGIANLTETIPVDEVFLDIERTDIFFRYVVQLEDNTASLTHASSSAFVLPAGATIMHATMDPVVAADTLLREPGDLALSGGELTRQWKFNYAQKVELLLRDLYHTEASSLSTTLEHEDRRAKVFSNACAGLMFGKSYPGARLGNNATIFGSDTGIGDSFLFSDSQAANIALRGSVEQSSTLLEALRAVDGLTHPLAGDSSVSETLVEQQAWWQILLPGGANVSTVNIWPRNAQEWVTPLLTLTLRGLEGYAQGSFRLRISHFLLPPSDPTSFADTSDALLGFALTEPMPFNVSASELKKRIEDAGPVGNVAVERDTLQQCDARGGGCGTGIERGYGYIYTMTFNDLAVEAPLIEVTDLVFLGGPVSNAGKEKTNVLTFKMSNHVDILRRGHFMGSSVLRYSAADPANVPSVATKGQSNEWLTPFSVMFFDHTPPTAGGLEAAAKEAMLIFEVLSIGKLAHIALQAPVMTSYIRIQRHGFGSLSLAEVEVFGEKINTLSSYDRGAPIVPSTVVSPYQPEESFSHAFASRSIAGTWLVEVSQLNPVQTGSSEGGPAPRAVGVMGYGGAYGSISEAVLIVTDLVGIVHTYYQDLAAEVTTLPKHGTLSLTEPSTPSPYLDWRESFEVGVQGVLTVRPGGLMKLGYCYGRETSEQRDSSLGSGRISASAAASYWCPESSGQGPSLDSQRELGGTPQQVFLRRERVVLYQPYIGFIGPDTLTYKVYDGLNTQTHSIGGGLNAGTGTENQIQLHVRNCRAYASDLSRPLPPVHPLCRCGQSERSIVSNTTSCATALIDLCSDASMRSQFSATCLACFPTASKSTAIATAQCKVQLIRSTSFLTSRGLCSLEHAMDCSSETVTLDGKDSVPFLSLGPASTFDKFTALGDSLGGQGYFSSAPLA